MNASSSESLNTSRNLLGELTYFVSHLSSLDELAETGLEMGSIWCEFMFVRDDENVHLSSRVLQQ